MSKKKQESLFAGVILLMIGVIFLMQNLEIGPDFWDFFGTYWPLILVAVGAKYIWQHYEAKKKEDDIEED
ncbi:MAG: hypothetical protein GY757_60335 [bacterium]|nr:hypothetical protein [bacterium]